MLQRVGKHSEVVRRLRALRRDARLRREQQVLLAEGPRLISEALDAGARIEYALVSPRIAERDRGREIVERLQQEGVRLLEAAADVVDALQDARSPQPVTAVVARPSYRIEAVLRGTGAAPLLIIADGIQDPGNLGGLVRTAAAAGATGVLVCGGASDPFHPRAVRATAGAAFRLPLLEVETETALVALAAERIVTIGAVPRAESDYRDRDFVRPVAICFGSESHGLDRRIAERLDASVRIPMAGGVESLSVGAAAAVLLFEVARQRER